MDSSFSLDENANRCPFKIPAPNATSTPRKEKPKSKYQCPQCGKEYQLKFYFDKHVASHHSQVSVTTFGGNVSSAVHIDCSDVSFRQLQDDLDISATSATNEVFKKPSPAGPPAKKKVANSKLKRKAQLICTYCLKSYVCTKSFKNHVRAHHIQTAAARFPNAAEIMDNSESIADKAMLSVSTSPSVGDSGARFKELVGHIASIAAGEEWKSFCRSLCKELVDSIRDKKCLLPSSLATNLIDKLERTLSNDKFSELMKVLNLGSDFKSDVISQFFLEFGLNFTTEVLKFISSTFRKRSSRGSQSGPVKLDKEDRQVVYYIAGSIMRGYLKIARRCVKSRTWQDVDRVLRSKVLVAKPTADMDPDSEWTSDVDRGKLLDINAQCQEFFLKLTEVVFAFEKKDGSIDYDRVISHVSNSEISVEWGSIISDTLNETVSINLMNDVILCFCRTCGRGFAKRRLNFFRKKPVVSLPTRHLVASRKNR